MKVSLYDKARPINFLSNENCICGSNLKFKDCCKSKGYKYSTLGKNFKEKEIIFNNIKVDEIYNKISNILLEEILDKDMSLSKGKELLKGLYDICEEGVGDFLKHSSCKKGCCNCCNLYLDCTAIEAELIREFVKKNFSEKEIKELELKIKNSIDKVPSYNELLENELSATQNYIKENQKCLFLSKDNICSIYKVRPLNCRKLISFSDPKYCNQQESIIIPKISINYITEYTINHLSMNVRRFKNIKLYSNKMKEEKSIYKSLYHWFENGFNDVNREI